MKTVPCPLCESHKVAAGRLTEAGGERGWGPRFYPDGLRFFALRRSVTIVEQRVYACGDCGHLWGKIDPARLEKLLANSATEETKEAFFEFFPIGE